MKGAMVLANEKRWHKCATSHNIFGGAKSSDYPLQMAHDVFCSRRMPWTLRTHAQKGAFQPSYFGVQEKV